MLVLSRKTGQTVCLGEAMEVTVLEVRGDTVKLGIVAPREVRVWRRELLEALKEENLRAAAKKVELAAPWSGLLRKGWVPPTSESDDEQGDR